MADKPIKPFNPETTTLRDIKNMPIHVIKTEIPSLAKSLGMDVRTLVQNLSPIGTKGGGLQEIDGECSCCHSDSW